MRLARRRASHPFLSSRPDAQRAKDVPNMMFQLGTPEEENGEVKDQIRWNEKGEESSPIAPNGGRGIFHRKPFKRKNQPIGPEEKQKGIVGEPKSRLTKEQDQEEKDCIRLGQQKGPGVPPSPSPLIEGKEGKRKQGDIGEVVYSFPLGICH